MYMLFTFSRFLFTTLAIIYFVVVLKRGAVGSLEGQLIIAIIFAIPFTIIALKESKIALKPTTLKESLAFSLPLVPHHISGWILNMSDRILLERYVSLTQLGLYSLGYRIGMILNLLLVSVNYAWSPFFFRTAASDKNAPRIFARLTTYYAIAILMISLALSLLSREVIQLIASPSFWEAYRIVPIIVLAYLLNLVYFITVNHLFYTKHTGKLPFFTFTGAVANVSLNLITIPRFGVMAAAWNTVIGNALVALLTAREAGRIYPVPYETGRLLTLICVSSIIYLTGNILKVGLYFSVVFKLVLVLLLPVVLYLIGFFTEREKKQARKIVSSVLRRMMI